MSSRAVESQEGEVDMIIDGHLYSFPPFDSPQGYGTVEARMRVLQTELGGHHQPVWRVRDRAPADNSTLVNPTTSELRDVEWKRHIGQLVWTYEGETYTKQYLPPMLHNLECPPELIIAEMDYAGVDMGVLHTYPLLGQYDVLNGFLRDAVRRFPDRLMRLISVAEHSIPGDPEAAAQAVADEAQGSERLGLQFIPGFYYRSAGDPNLGHDEPWDDGAMRPFWSAVAALGIPVFFTLIGGRGSRTYEQSWQESYLEEQRVLMRLMDRHPEMTVVITHGLPWKAFLDGGRIVFPEAIWEVFDAPQCSLQLLIPIQMGGMWEYPWTEAEPTVKECVDRIGADRLMWGTDMPMVKRFCTFRQALGQFKTHCDFLSAGERDAILGGTSVRVMGLGA